MRDCYERLAQLSKILTQNPPLANSDMMSSRRSNSWILGRRRHVIRKVDRDRKKESISPVPTS